MSNAIKEEAVDDLAFQKSPQFAAAVEKYGLDVQTIKYLCESAVKVKSRAACRYSNFRVGAALLTSSSLPSTLVIGSPLSPYPSPSSSGLSPSLSNQTPSPNSSSNPTPQIIVGVNVENAAYPVGTCAERCALGTAISLGHKAGSFLALAVNTDSSPPTSPCGMCRQFIREFCTEDMPVFMVDVRGEWEVRTVGELLPLSFGPENLREGTRT